MIMTCTLMINSVLGQEQKIDSTILKIESAVIDNMLYRASISSDYSLQIKDSTETVVFTLNNTYPNFEFRDYDQDGYKDLIISHISNVPGREDRIRYNPNLERFILIEGFSDYPNALRIEGTKYLYSYHRSGCADKNWDSDLFYIENHQTVKIGNIAGRECDDDGVEDGIYIYKLHQDKLDLIQTIHIDTINKYQDYKWGFIADYWNKKYLEFR